MPSRPPPLRPSSLAAALPAEAWHRLDAALDHFEAAWRAGRRPDIARRLPGPGALRHALLVELAHAEMEVRLQAGEPALAEDYLGRFPELAADPTAAVGLIQAEYAMRRHQDEEVSAGEYLARFPRYLGLLMVALANLPPERGAPGPPAHAVSPDGSTLTSPPSSSSRPAEAPGPPGAPGSRPAPR
jgi:hypothetical protein